MAKSDRFDADLTAIVLRSTGATISSTEVVQSLWSGYGKIVRCHLTGGPTPSLVLKHGRWPEEQAHKYGWMSDRSHQRKLKSYEVEAAWYGRYAKRCLESRGKCHSVVAVSSMNHELSVRYAMAVAKANVRTRLG